MKTIKKIFYENTIFFVFKNKKLFYVFHYCFKEHKTVLKNNYY